MDNNSKNNKIYTNSNDSFLQTLGKYGITAINVVIVSGLMVYMKVKSFVTEIANTFISDESTVFDPASDNNNDLGTSLIGVDNNKDKVEDPHHFVNN